MIYYIQSPPFADDMFYLKDISDEPDQCQLWQVLDKLVYL